MMSTRYAPVYYMYQLSIKFPNQLAGIAIGDFSKCVVIRREVHPVSETSHHSFVVKHCIF